jgi:ABC-type antimicrobial peptide transport system permease subunit
MRPPSDLRCERASASSIAICPSRSACKTLGARPVDVLRSILGDNLRQTIGGVIIGLVGGVLLMRLGRTLLFGVAPADPLTLAGVALVLIVSGLAAALIPAGRAMRVDPAEAMREG